MMQVNKTSSSLWSIYLTLVKQIYKIYTVSCSSNTNGVQEGPSGIQGASYFSFQLTFRRKTPSPSLGFWYPAMSLNSNKLTQLSARENFTETRKLHSKKFARLSVFVFLSQHEVLLLAIKKFTTLLNLKAHDCQFISRLNFKPRDRKEKVKFENKFINKVWGLHACLLLNWDTV
jgi:hypothetical protein